MLSLLDIRTAVSEYEAHGDGEAAKSQDLTLALLDWCTDPLGRTSLHPGHITCTGCVLSKDRERVLLVYHKRLDRWLLPGGHVEPEDATAADAARREVLEETGVSLVPCAPLLVGIDVHPIPPGKGEPLHLHHDLIWGFTAASEETVCSEESRAVVWAHFQEFDSYDLAGSIRRAVIRLLGRHCA